MPKSITIIGGGLAGLTLGIGLRREKIPVSIIEAGHYPRHRICGEFISGRGQETLGRLGLLEPLRQAGSNPAATAAFVLPQPNQPVVRRLRQSAVCLSRFKLDAMLAERFREAGGDLQENTRWRSPDVEEGMVQATGRRLQSVESGMRWFGLKVHGRGTQMIADLEMHILPDAYVGLCRLSAGEVNICGLFRRPAEASGPAPGWRDLLRGQPGTSLRQRLESVEFDEDSFCSVAGLSLKPRRAKQLKECCLGDALTMIPPVTGNGMSMAFESAEIATGPLAAYGRGEVAWDFAQQRIAAACDARFTRRLRWAQWLQWAMFSPVFQNHLGNLALRSNLIWQLMFRNTR
jgi:2-polyprenyl-6-methoxyphenol hydroxylase-like FAD-dependent oxidoreductase